MVRMAVSAAVIATTLHACSPLASSMWGAAEAGDKPAASVRADAIARAQVWAPTRIPAMDIRTGPKIPGAFAFRATIACDYLPKELSGASPKFACGVGEDDDVKVKYGGTNAEVYAEVAATRLLWALGFGADAMYPVRIVCRGCPSTLAGIAREGDQWVFDPATVERKMHGRELGEDGWSWKELDAVNEEAGGAPKAHRDALKLLAVFLQHTDTKARQQRVMCLEEAPAAAKDAPITRCARPFLMVSDVGLTFGRANTFNVNDKAMNLVEWAATPVWKGATGCVGNLPKSLTGTLDNPAIGEAGRRFLAGLLAQLTDTQIRDLFEVSRVTLRLREPSKARSGFATVEEWVDAFKQKRDQIAERRCA